MGVTILSNGHGSMLIYSLLHLTGYDLQMKELERCMNVNMVTHQALKPQQVH